MSDAGSRGQRFAFIDSSACNRLSSRLVRSHAMKGKNMGKRHHRRSRLDLDLRQHRLAAKAVPSGCALPTLNQWSAPLHSVSPFPIRATFQTRDAINRFFACVTEALLPPAICCSLDKVTSFWWRFLFVDQTAHHCTLALLCTLNGFFLGEPNVSHEALYHLSRAVSLVNEQLGTTKALSNSTLVVVNFLVVYEIVRESRNEAEIHLKGLQKMVDMRGGLASLEASEDALLVLKTDIDCALSYGTTPGFYRDRMSDVIWCLTSQGFSMIHCPIDSNPWFNELSPTLGQLLLEVVCIGQSFDKGYKLDPYMFQEFLVSLGYRLIHFHPLGDSNPRLESKVDQACHIGLTVYLTTLFLRRGNRCFLRYRLIAQQLKDIIETGLEGEHNDLMLWLLFIGGVSVLEDLDQAWLGLRIRQAAQSLEVNSWKGIQLCLTQFPWIGLLHNEAGEALWRRQEELL
ncbi:hypothetical protein PV08_11116 [Exophiala spinifera]|uniref:Transcription factor domain-containing protein n=1 Tax=Exophiala spinifera TaxID=91928 RepID=A0A0D2AUI0_9EURO|nr:uncharacterized protein PV08_11116 [Exophiala spinifera]KIW10155.1 hypothetical protein PV08_11116 [Exophiala spinifera]